MARMHIHIAVPDINKAVAFYASVFGVAPTVRKDDYAKWSLDDPKVNLAISTRSARHGVDHIGIQADSAEELGAFSQRFDTASLPVAVEGEVTCCYARSDKRWLTDTAGVSWEVFHSLGTAEVYGDGLYAPQASCGESDCGSSSEVTPVVRPEAARACCPTSASRAPESEKSGCC